MVSRDSLTGTVSNTNLTGIVGMVPGSSSFQPVLDAIRGLSTGLAARLGEDTPATGTPIDKTDRSPKTEAASPGPSTDEGNAIRQALVDTQSYASNRSPGSVTRGHDNHHGGHTPGGHTPR